MATINLGSIKFNWQGAYAGGTAYAVDDVVSYNGSSYVCTAASTGNLPTDTNFWDQMSSAGTDGTNGTDLTTTLTTQGDILYRDGSGLQRLPKGTAGQVLQMNSGATAPEYGDISAGLTPSAFVNLNSDSGSTNSQTWYNIGGSSIGGAEIYDTDNAVSQGIFTVPSGKGGTYLVNIFSSHSGSSNHGGSDGTMHRLQVSTDSGSSWTVTPTNGEYKTIYLNNPGAEMIGAFSPHIAYNLSAGHQLRAQVWSYKGASTDVVWRAGDTNGSGAGSPAGTFYQLMKIF